MKKLTLVITIVTMSFAIQAQTTNYGYQTSNSPSDNAFFGAWAGHQATQGNHNSFFGMSAGRSNTGYRNTFIGYEAGRYNTSGNNNTYLGRQAGRNNTSGSGNVLLGYRAGYNFTGSNRLFIDNSETSEPLIFGDFSTDNRRVVFWADNGVAINTWSTAGYDLSVAGKIRAEEVKVYTGWADFVFEDNYYLPSLTDVETHIKEKGHLKDIPSAKEVEENGIMLGEMNSKLLQKIEELTLYLIEQDKRIKVLEKELEERE